MKEYKILVLSFLIFIMFFIFEVESIWGLRSVKITLEDGRVFYGTIWSEKSDEIIVEIDSIFINFDKKEIKSITSVSNDTLGKKSDKIEISKGIKIEDDIEKFINLLGKNYKIDPALIKAIIKAESNFDRFATSRKGARGLMQLMPQTAECFNIFDIYNPYQNIEGGVKYLRTQLSEFNEDIRLALAAYNAGPEKVKIYNGIPPFPETRRFIEKVLRFYNYFKRGGDIMSPKKVIYGFKDKKSGTFIITDIPPYEELYIGD